MNCIKLYFRSDLIGVLTYINGTYTFVKNKFYNNNYILDLVGVKDDKEVYVSKDMFKFFYNFILRYPSDKNLNEFSRLVEIGKLDLNRSQFWIGV